MSRSERPLATLWIGGMLGDMERACLKSAVRQGQDVHLYSYHDVPNLPAGITHLDAREVIPEADIFRYDGVGQERLFGSYGPFSDVFRYRLMSLERGIWIDADIYFVKPLDQSPQALLAWEGPQPGWFRKPKPPYGVGTAVQYMPASSPVLADLMALSTPPYRMPPWLAPDVRARVLKKLNGRPFHPGAVTYATIGPMALTHFVRKHRAEALVMPHTRYFPVSFRELGRFAAPDARFRTSLPRDTEVVHMWNSNFSQVFADGCPKGSFADRVLEEGLDA